MCFRPCSDTCIHYTDTHFFKNKKKQKKLKKEHNKKKKVLEMQLYRVFSYSRGVRLKVRSDVRKPRKPRVQMLFSWSGEGRGSRRRWWGGLVTAAGAAGGLSRLCQVHASVPPAAGSGGLRLVLGKLLCCNGTVTRSVTVTLKEII